MFYSFFPVFFLSLSEKICFNFENFIFSFLYLCFIVSCNTKLPQMENDLMEIRINPSDFLFEDDFETIKKEPMENSRQEDLTASPIIAEFIIRQKCGPQTLITRTIPKPPMMWNTSRSFIEQMIQFGASEIQKKTFSFKVMRQHRLDLQFKNPEMHYKTMVKNQNFHFEHPHNLNPPSYKTLMANLMHKSRFSSITT